MRSKGLQGAMVRTTTSGEAGSGFAENFTSSNAAPTGFAVNVRRLHGNKESLFFPLPQLSH
jgi:hypothetical protein